jgi:hypothetical protein
MHSFHPLAQRSFADYGPVLKEITADLEQAGSMLDRGPRADEDGFMRFLLTPGRTSTRRALCLAAQGCTAMMLAPSPEAFTWKGEKFAAELCTLYLARPQR